jgi:ribosome-associated protein
MASGKKSSKAKPAKGTSAKAKGAPAKRAPAKGSSTKVKPPQAAGDAVATKARRAQARRGRTTPPAPTDAPRAYAIDAARLLADYDCADVVVLDVRALQDVQDYIVIGSGTSATQMRSLLGHVEDLGRRIGYPAFRVSRDERGLWLLLDCVDVVVHLFEPSTRAHYDLEMMWGDAPRVAWERPDQVRRDRAGVRD